MDNAAFQYWLTNSVGLQLKSARDVVSRVRRASKYVDLDLEIGNDKLIDLLQKNPAYEKLSMYVRSQLRRAVLLYREYNHKG